jgi:hypothetical protein
LLIIAAGFIASTLLAALLTYLVARLMNVRNHSRRACGGW